MNRTPHLRVLAILLALAANPLSMEVSANVGSETSAYFERAEKFFQDGKLREARIELKNALRENPDSAKARLLMGKVHFLSGDFRSAEKEFRRSYKALPSDEAAVLLGEIHVRDGNWDKALEQVAGPAASPAMQIERHVVAGAAHMGLKDFSKAEAEYRKIIVIDPNRIEAHFGLARTMVASKNTAEADRLVDQIIAGRPDYTPAIVLKGEIALGNSRHDVAYEMFTRAMELSPNDFSPVISRARTQLAAGDVAGARADAQHLDRMLPGAPIVHYILAAVSFAEGDYDAANRSFTQLQRSFDSFPPAVLLGALIKFERNELSQANSLLTRYLKMEPSNVDARRALATVRLRSGQPSSAVDILERILDENPNDIGSVKSLASAYLALDRYDDARKLYQRLAELGGKEAAAAQTALALLEPGNRSARTPELEDPQFRARVLKATNRLSAGDVAAAEDAIEELETLASGSASVLALKGGLAAAKGKPRTARDYLEEALAKDPELIAAHNAIETVENQIGEGDRTTARLRKLLDQKPDSELLTMRLSASLARSGQRAEALELLVAQSRRLPNSPEILRAVTAELFFAGRREEAKETALRIARAPNADTDALIFAIGALRDVRATAETVSVTTELMRRLPDSPRAATIHAEALANNGQTEQAYRVLDDAQTRWPREIQLTNAYVAIAVGARDEAATQQATKRLAVLDPIAAAQLRARALGELGQPIVAVDILTKAFAQRPSSALAIDLFSARRRAGRTDAAFGELRAWLEQNPQDRGALLTLANALLDSGETAEAERRFSEYLRLDPRNPVALNNYAWLRYHAGRSDALVYAERAFQAASGEPAIVDTYGWLLVQNGKLKEGLSLLARAAGAAPQNPEISYHLAYALAKVGRNQEARQRLSSALSKGDFADRDQAEALMQTLR